MNAEKRLNTRRPLASRFKLGKFLIIVRYDDRDTDEEDDRPEKKKDVCIPCITKMLNLRALGVGNGKKEKATAAAPPPYVGKGRPLIKKKKKYDVPF